MAFIYKITNKVNGKVYIGKTHYTIEKRFKEHCRDRNKRTMEKRPLYRAMNKYGVENFIVEEIEQTNQPEERERYWIEYYDSYHNGYNATIGGDGKPYIDYDAIYQLFQQGKTEKEIAKQLNCSIDSCRVALRSKGVLSEEIKDNANKRRRKAVAQIDKNTGEILQIFNSVNAANAAMGVTTRGHVGKVCNGQRATAYGFVWCFLDDLK